jgi:aryl-alcohol dehydrogenase-like predicted oxidoreductase
MTRRVAGMEVSPLCLGGNVFGWTLDAAAGFRVLDAYRDLGGTFLDTADVYANWEPENAGGESEEIIGAWLRRSGARDEMVVATKVGAEMAPDRKGLAPAYIRSAVEDSLRRLGVDHIDLLYAHYDDPDTPIEDTLAAFDALVREGKVRAIAASNFSAERLAASLEVSRREGLAGYAALQPEYNLLDRAGFEAELEPLCREHGLAVMPYYALANGLLTGKYRRDVPLPDTPRAVDIRDLYLTDGNDDRVWDVVEAVVAIAADRGATPAQIALAWLLDRDTVTAPIASATTPEQVAELMGAADIRLTDADRSALSAAGPGR